MSEATEPSLTDAAFSELLGCTRQEFAALQPWKQNQLRLVAGLATGPMPRGPPLHCGYVAMGRQPADDYTMRASGEERIAHSSLAATAARFEHVSLVKNASGSQHGATRSAASTSGTVSTLSMLSPIAREQDELEEAERASYRAVRPAFDPQVGTPVSFSHKGAETTGRVILRQGHRLRVEHVTGTCWVYLTDVKEAPTCDVSDAASGVVSAASQPPPAGTSTLQSAGASVVQQPPDAPPRNVVASKAAAVWRNPGSDAMLLAARRYRTAALASALPPAFTCSNKQALHAEILKRVPPPTPSETLHFYRVGAGALPEVMPPSPSAGEDGGDSRPWCTDVRPGVFAYDPSDERTMRWHVNFADKKLFGYYHGNLFAQDEVCAFGHHSPAVRLSTPRT